MLPCEPYKLHNFTFSLVVISFGGASIPDLPIKKQTGTVDLFKKVW